VAHRRRLLWHTSTDFRSLADHHLNDLRAIPTDRDPLASATMQTCAYSIQPVATNPVWGVNQWIPTLQALGYIPEFLSSIGNPDSANMDRAAELQS